MLFKSKFFRIFLFSFLIFACVGAAFADIIRLKDGSIIKGRITGFRDGQFQILIGDGARQRQMNFFSDEIESIEFESVTTPTSAVKIVNTNPNTTAALPRPTPTPVPTVQPSNTPSGNTPIIVGQTNNQSNNPSNGSPTIPTQNPRVNPTPTPTPNNTNTSTVVNNPPITNNSRPKPIQLNLKVLADNTANGWTNAGWVVKKGQKIKITSNGRISLGNGNYSNPSGLASLADKDKLIQSQPTGGLIAVIGDDNNDFLFIGNSKEFTATRDGALFLGINEGVLDDNSGSYDVVIEIDVSGK